MDLHVARLLPLAIIIHACGAEAPPELDTDATCASCPTLTWSNGPALPQKRDHHVTFVGVAAGAPTLFAAGGTSTTSSGTTLIQGVSGAEVRADGSLGEWTSRGVMPNHLAGQTVSVSATHVYMTGGIGRDSSGGAAVLGKTYVASLAEGGMLETWREGPELPVGRFHGSAEIVGSYLYAVGGAIEMANPPVPTDSVARALVGADGELGEWEALAPLPEPRSHHALVSHAGALWVLGGITGELMHTSVLRAPIDAHGVLGAWETRSDLPLPLATHAAFVRDGALYVIGGVGLEELANTVNRASFTTDGGLSPWEEVHNPPPMPRSHVHQTPQWGRCVYSVAGGDHTSIQVHAYDNVFVGCF